MAMHPLRSTPRKPVIDYHGARITDSALQGVFGTYEYIEMELAELLFIPNDRVIVAGAGMGWLMAWIAQIIGPHNVLGVEPNDTLANLINQNVRVENEPLQCLAGALTPDGQPTRLTHHPDWSCRRTLVPVPHDDMAPLVSGYDLCVLMAQGWDCIALDVEGAEAQLLTPAVLGACRKLLVEIHTASALQPGQRAQLQERLQSDGGLILRGHRVRENGDEFEIWERDPSKQ
jgi:FkbM family methyltransferase